MSASSGLKLAWIAGRYAIWRAERGGSDGASLLRLLAADRLSAVRSDLGAGPSPEAGGLISVTSTHDEFSIVCDETTVPSGARAERGFAALRVAGTLDIGLIGILESIARPLADARIALFALSTFDTDYILVRASDAIAATAALRAAGHTIDSSRLQPAPPSPPPDP